jgi:predicted O-linked N-acetylglucosamine transferase (SPINDLY family)
MAQATLQQPFDLALQYHHAGRLREAEQYYRQTLAQQPQHADALHLLGVLAHQAGQIDIAVDFICRAIALNPNRPEAHYNLGNALRDGGLFDAAIAAYRHATALRPNYAEAHCNLGNVLKDQGQAGEAIIAYRQAIACNRGLVQAYSSLGDALNKKGQVDEALVACRQALALRPDYAEAHNNLGNALLVKGQIDEAIAAYRQAIALSPDDAHIHSNLGAALSSGGQLDEALTTYRHTIALRPNYSNAYNNLAGALIDQGQLSEAVDTYRQALEIDPGNASIDSNLVYILHFHPAYDGRAIAKELCRWNRRHAEPLRKSVQRHTNELSPDRRLRIGYVSPHLRAHPIGRFLLPLLSRHDHAQFEIHCYSDVRGPDGVTARLKKNSDHWHDTTGFSDEQLAEQIRLDGIDILLDLSMHMAANRLLVFARKPAPVQVTWLAYAGSAGLSAIDYRLSDPYLDPPGGIEHYSEQTIRIPSYWCYEPPQSPAVNALPAAEAGFVTFGCLNNFCKVSPATLTLWSDVLQKVDRSRLLIHSHAGSHRESTLRWFADRGIDRSRIDFVGLMPLDTYLLQYQRLDIALDTTPYGGGTTTCDGLWMGVPTVTLSGQTAVGRGGVSLLSNLGLTELIARTPEQYVRAATDLAKDLPRLAELRSSLRQRMERSPLTDAPRFARDIEAAYRQMWGSWCNNPPS